MMGNSVKVNYESAIENNVRADAERAIQLFLSGSVGTVLTIFPQALNPLLKALESLGLWKEAIVLPSQDSSKRPLYIVIKVPKNSTVDFISFNSEE